MAKRNKGKWMLSEVSAKGKTKLGVLIVTKLYIMGKSQTWLASQCGCNKAFISQIVHGKCKPGAEVSKKIGEVLGIEEEEIRRLALEAA